MRKPSIGYSNCSIMIEFYLNGTLNTETETIGSEWLSRENV